jgi:hypothetical protein
VIEILSIRKIAIFIFIEYLTDKYTHPNASLELCDLEAYSLASKSRNWIVSKAKSLILRWRKSLYGIPTSNMNAFPTVHRRIDNEELKL